MADGGGAMSLGTQVALSEPEFRQLQALFYKDEQAPQRQPYQIRCEAVSRFQCTLDSDELKRNMFAGNISNGYLKGNTLWIYFTDGLLEVRALCFRLMKS